MPNLENIHYKFFPKSRTSPLGKKLIYGAWFIEIIVAMVSLSIAYALFYTNALGFDVPTTLTKSKMIDSFKTQTDEFIQSLQDSGEFMSASDSDDDGDDKTNIKDGGYF